jgi:hypothetical protein
MKLSINRFAGLFVFFMSIVSTNVFAQVPTITSFTPTSGPIGTEVTIIGTNFSTTSANNTVFFGATKATVTTATATQLTITVPYGATYMPITVLVNELVAFSSSPFIVTFGGGGAIDGNSFEAKVDYTIGANAIYSMSIGDLDGDGKADLAVTNYNSSTVSIFRNTSTVAGTISYASKVDFNTGINPISISVGDLDGDGKADLAVANNGRITVSILRNISTGVGSISYATKVDYATGSNPRSVKIGDLDADGKSDLTLANRGNNSVSIFLNTTATAGTISYANKVDFTTGTSPESVSIGDLDGDGKADLAVANSQSNTVSIFRNSSTGAGTISYASKVDYTTGTYPISVSIGDLDGDGKADLAITNYTNLTVSILRNTGTGAGTISYASKVDYTTGTAPYSVSIADLDGDGKTDLAIANQSSNTLSILRNTSTAAGTISYASKVDFTTGTSPQSVAIGDFDGDGKSDLAVANNNSGNVSIFRNAIVASASTATDFTAFSLSEQTGAGTINTIDHTVAIEVTAGTSLTALIPTFTLSNGASVKVGATSQVSATTSNDFSSAVIYAVTAEDGTTTQNWTVTVTAASLHNIVSFTPTSGPVGTAVNITGTNFDGLPANNTVFFGATQATVTAATATQLTVTVPSGATYQPITVLVNGLFAYSSAPFVVTFPESGTIDASSFAAKVDQTTNATPYAASIGDLDGDGKLDMAVVNHGTNTVSVFRNTSTASGSFSYAAKVDYTTGTLPWSVTIGDLDGDGKPELAIANRGSNTVSVFQNTSTGSGNVSYAAKADFATGINPQSVAIGDFDKDGKPDLAVDNSNSNTLSVFRNTSTGSGNINYATKVDYTTGTKPYSVSAGDLDGDGWLDLVVANNNSSTLSVFRNTSTGEGSISYAAKLDYTTGTPPQSVLIGDLDGDGKPDLAVGITDAVAVFRNTSTGSGNISYAAKVDYSTGSGFSTTAVSISDLNGDGKLDVAAVTFGTNKLSVFRNTSTGSGSISYAAKADYSTGTNPQSVAIGDMGGDGKADLVVANYNSASVSVFRNTITPPLPTITSFTPKSGPVGTAVTIIGTEFSTTPTNNIVFFGATKATVTAATATSLTVTVPTGASYQPITVLVNGLMAYSSSSFLVTFDGGGVIDATSFAAKIGLTDDEYTYGVALGDIDNDGKLDLIATSEQSSSIVVYRNISVSGEITASSFDSRVEFVTENAPRALALGDIDGDGKLDIAAGFNNFIYIFRNTSTPGQIDVNSFAAKVDVPTSTAAYSVAIHDLDADGKSDLIVGGSMGILIFKNIGSAGAISLSTTFDTELEFTIPSVANGLAIGDLNDDGKPDLVVSNQGTDNISILKNVSTAGVLSSSSFDPKVDLVVGDFPWGVAIGDLDGDSKPDIAVANRSSNLVSVLRNVVTGGDITASSFETKVDFTTGTGPTMVVMSDMDGDAKLDLVVANISSTNVSILKNISSSGAISTESFASLVSFDSGGPFGLAIGDIDGDGKNDLAASAWSGVDGISVLRNVIGEGASSETDITAFTIPNQTYGAINTVDHTIEVIMPKGSSVTALSPTIEVSEGATISPLSGVAQDFTNTVTYTVTSEDGATTQIWEVSVLVEEDLFGYYTFDGDLSDTGVLGNGGSFGDGTTASTFPTFGNDRFSAENKALSFDGDAYARVDYKINLSLGTSTDLSVSGWFRSSSTMETTLFDKSTGMIGFKTLLNPDGSIYFYLADASGSVSVTSTTGWNDGNWHHYAVSVDRDAGLYVYMDGASNAEQLWGSTTINPDNGEDLLIGVRADAGNTNFSNYFVGEQDEIQIYSKTLLAQEVSDLYDSQAPDNLVGYYPFNGNANDNSGYGRHGTVTGAVLATDRHGITDAAYSFAAAGDQISASAASGMNQNFSVTAWVKLDGNLGGPILEYYATGEYVFQFEVDGENKLYLVDTDESNSETVNTGTTVLSLDQWYHVGLVKEGASVTFYIDGQVDSGLTSIATLRAGGSDINIGGAGTEFFNGSVDDVRIYDITLLDAEILEIYDAEKPVAELSSETEIVAFSFDKQTGAAIIDATAHTISIEVLNGTNVASLIPTITVSAGATLSPLNGVAQDFTTSVIYTVTAEDGTTTQDWMVTVSISSIPEVISASYDFSGAAATDITGNGYDGVGNLSPLFSMDRFGSYNSALEPEGNGTYVSISHNGAWDMQGAVMLNGWIRPNALPESSEFGHVIFREDNFGELDINPDGSLFYHWSGGTIGTDVGVIRNNQWTMVTLLIDYDNNLQLFVNGSLQQIGASGESTSSESVLITRHTGVGTTAYFGDNSTNGSDNRWFSGSIDDFKIRLNGSFAASDIQTIYESELSGGADQRVVFFPFDNGSLQDQSGNNYEGSFRNISDEVITTTTTIDRFGNANGALLFDNTGNSNHVFHERSINLNNNFTINLWINPTSIANTGNGELGDVLINDNAGGRFMVFNDASLAYHYPANNGSSFPAITSSTLINTGEWQMVTYSIDDTGILKLYYNGDLVQTGDASDHDLELNDRFIIAQADDAGGSDQRYYDGALDDVGVYQRTLSDEEVRAMYISEGLVAHYTFDGNAIDKSGNGYDATVNGATLTADRHGNADGAYSFNGTSGYISAANIDNHPSGDINITYMAWVKVANSQTGNIISFGELTTNKRSSFLYEGTALGFAGQNNDYASTAAPAIGEWNHVAVTKSGLNIEFFINGLSIDQGTIANPLDITNLELVLGASPSKAGEFFNGDIDEVRVYSSALSASDIDAIYQSEKPAIELSNETALVAFSFSEETGPATIGMGTIAIEVASGTDVTTLVSTFELSTGASAKVASTDQESGITANNFTNQVAYSVTAEDGVTTQDWVVTVSLEGSSNSAPVVSVNIPDQTFAAGFSSSNYDISGTFSDPDSDDLSYTVSSSNESVVTVAIAGTTLTFAEQGEGSATVTVTASDGTDTVDDVFEVIIQSNTSPTIANAIADINTVLDSDPIEIDLSTVFSDSDGDELFYSAENSNTSVATVGFNDNFLGITKLSVGTTTITVTASDGNAQVEDQFVLTITEDNPTNNPPVIGAPIFDSSYLRDGSGSTVSVTVTDEDGDLENVTLYYRNSSETTNHELQLTNGGANSFGHTFADADFNDLGLAFYFTATDGTNPIETSDTFAIATIVPANSTVVSGLSTGTTESDYGMLSLPFQRATVGTILEDLGATDKEAWRLFHYNGSSNTELTTSSSFEPGKGYWFISTAKSSIVIGEGTSVDVSESAPFILKTNNGWNQIGNPFPFKVNWNEVIAHNNLDTEGGKILAWNGGYGSVSTLGKYAGAFFKHDGSDIEIPLSAICTSCRSSETPVAIENLGQPGNGNWMFGLNLKNNSLKYQVSVVGMDEISLTGNDVKDLPPLPRLSGYLDLIFDNGNTRDMVSILDEFSWSFEVQTTYTDEQTSLNWDNFILQGNFKGLYLYDKEKNIFIDMSQSSTYSFLPTNGAYGFQLFFGTQQYAQSLISAEQNYIASPYPNPSKGMFILPVALNGKDSDVSVVVRDLSGRSVMTKNVSTLMKGYHEIEIDLSNEDGRAVPTGTYIIEMNIITENKSSVFRKKIIYSK